MEIIFVLLLLFVVHGADGSRVVGGRDSVPHSRPYMASFQIHGYHNCGGLLVREDFVLTAAHCQMSISNRVVLGAHSLTANESTKQYFRAVRSIPHPNYREKENDIMLLKLDGRARLTEAVQLIPLNTASLSPSSQCIVAGWGVIDNANTLPNNLQEINVTVVPQRTCQRQWAPTRIARSMVCGDGARISQGACRGDSGGPLVCDGAAAGVVSFGGFPCGERKVPDVYTRVSSFTAWIRSVLSNN